MCGLAGYNIRPDIAAELTDKQARRILSAGIRQNLHRGTDATGYMASFPDEPGLYFVKGPFSGDKFLANKKAYLPKPGASVLAIHTRAASKDFDPAVNANNHPVRALGVAVTHNGIIRSHSSYRFKLDKEIRDALPDVDSAVINAHFAGIVDPIGEMDDIVALIKDLKQFTNSGYAFHLMWENYPGVSVIVRGPEYPMHYIVDDNNGMHVYASQEAAAREIAAKLGNNRFEEKLHANFLSGSAMIVVDGKAEWYGNFEPKTVTSWSSNGVNYPSQKYTRLRFDRKARQVYETSTSYHWSAKAEVTSVLDAQLAEARGQGYVLPIIEGGLLHESYNEWLAVLDKNNQKHSGSNMLSKLWDLSTDAAHVYVWVPQPYKHHETMIFMLFGGQEPEVEMVFDYSMSLCDIYDWSEIDPEFEWQLYPWIKKQDYESLQPVVEAVVESDEEPVELTFKEWFESTTTAKEIDCEKYAPEDANLPKATAGNQLPMLGTSGSVVTAQKTESDGTTITTVSNKLTLEQFRGLNMKWFTECWYDSDVMVTRQMECKEHGEKYESHLQPEKCHELMLQAYTILGTCDRSVMRYMQIYGPQDVIRTFSPAVHEHEMNAVRFKPFQVKHDGVSYMYKVCTKQACVIEGCTEGLQLTRIPLLEKYYLDKIKWVFTMMESA